MVPSTFTQVKEANKLILGEYPGRDYKNEHYDRALEQSLKIIAIVKITAILTPQNVLVFKAENGVKFTMDHSAKERSHHRRFRN